MPSALTPYAGRYGTGLPYHNDTGPMDKRIDKFIFCVCHTRKTVQASGSPMFFLLLRRPPTLGYHTFGVWSALGRLRAREATGGPLILGGTADIVAGPRPRKRSVGGLQIVLGATKHRRRSVGARSSRGDARTAVLPTSESRRGRRRGSAVTGAGRLFLTVACMLF